MDAVRQNRTFAPQTIWVAVFFLVSVVALILGSSRPHLFSPGARLDLGNIGIGQTCEKAFPLWNHTSRPIEITGWSPTCHCVRARFPETLLLPGKSNEAYVASSATTPLGMRAAAVKIYWHFVGSNSIHTDELVVSAKYVAPLSLSNDQLDFSDVFSDQIISKTLIVKDGNTEGNWNGLNVVPASGRLSSRVYPTQPGFAIDVRIDPRGLPTGIWKSSLKIIPLENGKQTGKEMNVPVVARIEGPYIVSPPVLQFFGKPRSLHFTLQIHSSSVAIQKIRIPSNIVQNPSIEITRSGKDALVTGSITEPSSTNMFVGKIPLQINDQAEGALQISFIGYSG